MAKYSETLIHLRNQHKIKAVLGDEKLKIIKDSLQAVIDSNEDIKPEQIEGSKYNIIMIDDVSGENSMIAFYIIEAKFNIYRIAFKEFI